MQDPKDPRQDPNDPSHASTDEGHARADPPPAGELEPELGARLRALERTISPEEICELWIFPPLADVDGSAEFFLFTRFVEEDRRGLCSARLRREGDGESREDRATGAGDDASGERRSDTSPVDRNGSGSRDPDLPPQTITEHGFVPADRMPRLVERFRQRLGEDGEPLHFTIDGSVARWQRLAHIDGGPASP